MRNRVVLPCDIFIYLSPVKKKKRAEKTQRCRKCRQCHLSAARSGNIFMWHASCKVWQHGNLSAPSLQHLYLLTPTSTTYPSRRLLPQSAFRAPGGFIWDPSRDCHLNATLSRRNLGVWPGQIWGALCTHTGLSMGTHVARAPWRGADPEEQWNYPFGCFKWGWMHKCAQLKHIKLPHWLIKKFQSCHLIIFADGHKKKNCKFNVFFPKTLSCQLSLHNCAFFAAPLLHWQL